MMTPLLQILFGMAVLLGYYAVFRMTLTNLHMFQLNGYRADTHLAWMGKNSSRYLVNIMTLALGILFFFIDNKSFVALCAAVLLVLNCAVLPANKHIQAKKPLVWTPRVKRLTCTTILLDAVFAGVACYLLTTEDKYASFGVLAVNEAVFPLLVVLANLINKPVEFGVNNRYTREAKKMLSACPDLEVMGITGSFGKTSVKFYLYTILRAWKDTLVTPESYNTPMGVVKTVRGSLTPMDRIFLCEMGAKWVGDIKELCNIVHPKDGIITALGEQHLESFKSVENIRKTKYELSDALPADGRLYVNFDCESIRKNPPSHTYITYGTTPDCDWSASDIVITAKGTDFTVTSPTGESCRFHTKLLGRHSVLNITGAVAAAAGFGMKMDEMRLPIRRIEPVAHRMQLVEKPQATIIDDAYNSNPAGCEAALQTLRMMDGMKILVTPGMVELGEREEELNRTFGEQAAAVCDFVVLVGAKQTRPIADGLQKASFPRDRIFITDDFGAGMRKVYSISGDKKKIVLLENDLPDNY